MAVVTYAARHGIDLFEMMLKERWPVSERKPLGGAVRAMRKIGTVTLHLDDNAVAASFANESGLRRLYKAVQALGCLPDGFCVCSYNRHAGDDPHHEPECQDVQDALRDVEEE